MSKSVTPPAFSHPNPAEAFQSNASPSSVATPPPSLPCVVTIAKTLIPPTAVAVAAPRIVLVAVTVVVVDIGSARMMVDAVRGHAAYQAAEQALAALSGDSASAWRPEDTRTATPRAAHSRYDVRGR